MHWCPCSQLSKIIILSSGSWRQPKTCLCSLTLCQCHYFVGFSCRWWQFPPTAYRAEYLSFLFQSFPLHTWTIARSFYFGAHAVYLPYPTVPAPASSELINLDRSFAWLGWGRIWSSFVFFAHWFFFTNLYFCVCWTFFLAFPASNQVSAFSCNHPTYASVSYKHSSIMLGDHNIIQHLNSLLFQLRQTEELTAGSDEKTQRSPAGNRTQGLANSSRML